MIKEFMKAIKEKKRMCDSFETCEECYLDSSIRRFLEEDCYSYMENHPEEFLKDLDNWLKDNPSETNSNAFMNLFDKKSWMFRNSDHKTRCGIEKCDMNYPCAWCPWWNEPKNAEEYDYIYKDESNIYDGLDFPKTEEMYTVKDGKMHKLSISTNFSYVPDIVNAPALNLEDIRYDTETVQFDDHKSDPHVIKSEANSIGTNEIKVVQYDDAVLKAGNNEVSVKNETGNSADQEEAWKDE